MNVIRSQRLHHKLLNKLAIFNVYVPLKRLSIVETRFASTIVMLKRFKLRKQALQKIRTKSSTSLHCMAHFSNSRYYSPQLLQKISNRVASHQDEEIFMKKNKCLKRYFSDIKDRKKVVRIFLTPYVWRNRWELDPQYCWSNYGSFAPLLQMITLKFFVQPSSSSCSKKNWSRRNKLNASRVEDLVYIHTNLRLLSRRSEDYKKRDISMCDVVDDNSSNLNEPDMKAMMSADDGLRGEEIDKFYVSETTRVD
ncbi:hypothetical protein HN51_001380 [Arachis hypogaea]